MATRAALSIVAAVTLAAGCTGRDGGGRSAPDPGVRPPATEAADSPVARSLKVQEYSVPAGKHPHDVAPAPGMDGVVWYTAQASGELGRLDPKSGETTHIALGDGSSPHGVIIGPDGAPWVTDTGLNAIVRVDPKTEQVTRFPVPGDDHVGVHTASFDATGVLWFTGQSGYFGRLDPADGKVEVFKAPGGRGPYGITGTPDGGVFYASLAGSHIAQIDTATGKASLIEPPTKDQGARRVWADSKGRIWVSEWDAGQLGVYDPAGKQWREWRLPGDKPQAYAVFVDQRDIVWVTDFGANAIVRFDPQTDRFTVVPMPSEPANVRQLLGREGEVWGAESGVDKLVVIRTG
jgi:virginiamycin B lyase